MPILSPRPLDMSEECNSIRKPDESYSHMYRYIDHDPYVNTATACVIFILTLSFICCFSLISIKMTAKYQGPISLTDWFHVYHTQQP